MSLSFTYTGNRLIGAADLSAPGSNSYDLNGNRPLDSRTGLEFTYNLLNLPCEVRDTLDNMKMRYTYLSDGTKVSGQSLASLGTDNRYRYAGKVRLQLFFFPLTTKYAPMLSMLWRRLKSW